MRRFLAILIGLALALGLAAPHPAAAADPIVIGLQCDRTGPTGNIGSTLCPGYHDYVKLVNSKGGIEGHQIRVDEVDIEYKVPPAVEAYERFKKEGAVLVGIYGTPQTYALAQKCQDDKIPCTAPGFGIAASKDGQKYPYIFPLAASYWSQSAAAMKFIKQQLGGDLKGKKIAYLFYDNPAGREPIPVLEDIQAVEGFQLKTFAVPPPGVEMGAQALDIAQRYRADFVLTHLFGKAPSVSIKELKRVGYPLSKVISMVWGAAEADVISAGGWAACEGYRGLEFAGVGSDFPVIKEIAEMYKKAGQEPPKEMQSTVYYNRGVLVAAVHLQAVRNALKAKKGGKITGEDVKKGMESISNFTEGGLVPPLKLTPEDHEGGGLVQVVQVKGGKFVKDSDWMNGYVDIVNKHVAAAAKK
jgi:branched-chain amino acid transport system substrate-binding protein